uniref:Uncharacterized protein n=1 Tax=Aegilops tauschii subsp. strangulata TaxID=200361 RepID=A0A453GUJ4_AEGTS
LRKHMCYGQAQSQQASTRRWKAQTTTTGRRAPGRTTLQTETGHAKAEFKKKAEVANWRCMHACMSRIFEVDLDGVGALAELAVEQLLGHGERRLLAAAVGAAVHHPVDVVEDGLPVPLRLPVHHRKRPLQRLLVGGFRAVAGQHLDGLRHGNLPQLHVVVVARSGGCAGDAAGGEGDNEEEEEVVECCRGHGRYSVDTESRIHFLSKEAKYI